MSPPVASPAPRRRTSVKVLLVLGALLAALLAGEVACRIRAHLRNQGSMEVAFSTRRHLQEGQRVALIDIIRMSDNPKIVFELKPGLAAVPFRGVPLTTNSLGFRGPEVAPEEEPGTITIVGVGDSIMFGWGVPDGQNYLAILETLLRQKHPERRWRVLNLAAPAYNTVMEVETLRRKGLAFGPDLVILGLVMNDLSLPGYIRVVENVFDPTRSFLFELIRARVGGPGSNRNRFELLEGRDPRLARSSNKDLKGDVPEEYRQLAGWQPFRNAIADLAELSKQHGFPVLTVTTVEDDAIAGMIGETDRAGFQHVRLLPEIQRWLAEHQQAPFSAQDPSAYLHSALVVDPSDGHPSVLQHRMAAQKLLDALETSGLVDQWMR